MATYAFSIAKLGKVGKVGKLATAAKTIDKVDDVSDATTAYRASKGLKAADTVDDASDTSRAFKAADAVDDAGDANRAITSLDKLSPKDIQSMSLDDIRRSVPTDKGWTIHEHNGFVHIKDETGLDRIKLDPPDWRTDYPHMHIYDKNGNLLDINGNLVNKRSSAGHIPWDNGGK